EDASDDPVTREETALADDRMGQVQRELGEFGRAERAYRKAIALQDGLHAEFPKVATYRQELAASYNWLGELLRSGPGHRLREAEQAYRRALRLQEQLAAEAPGEPVYRKELGLSYNNLGIVQTETGRPAQAEESYGR